MDLAASFRHFPLAAAALSTHLLILPIGRPFGEPGKHGAAGPRYPGRLLNRPGWIRVESGHVQGASTTAGVDEFWFCGSSVIVWRAAGVVVASPTKRGCDRDRAALPRRDAR